MFATGDSRCPVEAYKFYASKRPEGMRDPDSPFYVATRTVPLRDPENDKWFINQRVGRKKLSKMMKQMQITGELNPAKRLTNHSARKHLVQKLRDSDVAPTDIMQISGHKNIQSVLTYSKMSEKQHRVCSDILSKSSTKSATVTKMRKRKMCLPNQSFLSCSQSAICLMLSLFHVFHTPPPVSLIQSPDKMQSRAFLSTFSHYLPVQRYT